MARSTDQLPLPLAIAPRPYWQRAKITRVRPSARWLNVKRPGPCWACGVRLTEGDRAWWDPEDRSLTCNEPYCRSTGGIPLDTVGMMISAAPIEP